LSVGVLVSATQLAVLRSEFCCKTRSVEGTVQETTRLLLEGAMFSVGSGVVCRVQIPPYQLPATSLFPSAEEATQDQPMPTAGTLFDAQVNPQSDEVKIIFEEVTLGAAAAINFLPSAEEATDTQARIGALLVIQVAPEFVET